MHGVWKTVASIALALALTRATVGRIRKLKWKASFIPFLLHKPLARLVHMMAGIGSTPTSRDGQRERIGSSCSLSRLGKPQQEMVLFKRNIINMWERLFEEDAPGKEDALDVIFEDYHVKVDSEFDMDTIDDGPFEEQELRIRVYCQRSPKESNVPVAVVFHGGHFVLQSCATREYNQFCCQLAAEGFYVASADYRRCPESSFPCAIEDAYSALASIVEGSVLPPTADTSRVVLIGFGSGGDLVAVLSSLVRDGLNGDLGPSDIQSPFEIVHQVIIGERFTADLAPYSGWFEKAYAADEQDRRANPWLAGMHDLPPTTVICSPHSTHSRDHHAYVTHLSQTGTAARLYTVEETSKHAATLDPDMFQRVVSNITASLDWGDEGSHF